ncbi:MAG: hypothetical protein EOP06_06215 [Proteobacteria bacterium]|nr:MAG: hypothetical protein EOP06_06215 [Pseudomonadota bacterium]
MQLIILKLFVFSFSLLIAVDGMAESKSTLLDSLVKHVPEKVNFLLIAENHKTPQLSKGIVELVDALKAARKASTACVFLEEPRDLQAQLDLAIENGKVELFSSAKMDVFTANFVTTMLKVGFPSGAVEAERERLLADRNIPWPNSGFQSAIIDYAKRSKLKIFAFDDLSTSPAVQLSVKARNLQKVGRKDLQVNEELILKAVSERNTEMAENIIKILRSNDCAVSVLAVGGSHLWAQRAYSRWWAPLRANPLQNILKKKDIQLAVLVGKQNKAGTSSSIESNMDPDSEFLYDHLSGVYQIEGKN